MKALIIPSWFATRKGDIAGNYILDHARAVKTTGWQADILYVHRALQSQSSVVVDRGVRVVRHGAPFSVKRGLLAVLWHNALKTAFVDYCAEYGTPDIIHAHGYVAGLAALQMTDVQIPVVVTEHNSVFVKGVPEGDMDMVKRVFSEVDSVIAVSNFLAEHMKPYCGQRIIVIPNPVDDELYSLPQADVDRNEVVCVAGLDPVKRVERAIDAFDLVLDQRSGLQLTIIGDGPERKNLERYAARPELAGHVSFTGSLPKEEIVQYLGRSAVLLSTSDIETFGITLVEALMCGSPVVCTPSGGVADIAVQKGAVMSKDKTPESIAQAVDDVLKEAVEPDQLRQYATTHFGYGTVGQKINEVYTRAIEARQS